MNILRIEPNIKFLNLFPSKKPSYFLTYPSNTPSYFERSTMTAKFYYDNVADATILLKTKASTWDEVKKLHPEYFI